MPISVGRELTGGLGPAGGTVFRIYHRWMIHGQVDRLSAI